MQNPYLISVVVIEQRGIAPESKKLAYLIDLQTVRIVDLLRSNATLATVNHDVRVDWLVGAWLLSTDGMARAGPVYYQVLYIYIVYR